VIVVGHQVSRLDVSVREGARKRAPEGPESLAARPLARGRIVVQGILGERFDRAVDVAGVDVLGQVLLCCDVRLS